MEPLQVHFSKMRVNTIPSRFQAIESGMDHTQISARMEGSALRELTRTP